MQTATAKSEWDRRSKSLEDTMKSVMFASFPEQLNESLHAWQLAVLERYIPGGKKSSILDIGCGYGRLSYPLSKQFPLSFFNGIDIAKHYVHLFNKKLSKHGKAVEGNLSILPFKDGSMDVVFVVTVLMYFSDHEITRILQEIHRVLKKDGTVIFIENNSRGVFYLTGFGTLTFLKGLLHKNIHKIHSRIFKTGQLERQIEKQFSISHMHHCTTLTLTLPVLLFLNRIGFLGNQKIRMNVPFPPLVSLYKCFVAKKISVK